MAIFPCENIHVYSISTFIVIYKMYVKGILNETKENLWTRTKINGEAYIYYKYLFLLLIFL